MWNIIPHHYSFYVRQMVEMDASPMLVNSPLVHSLSIGGPQSLLILAAAQLAWVPCELRPPALSDLDTNKGTFFAEIATGVMRICRSEVS